MSKKLLGKKSHLNCRMEWLMCTVRGSQCGASCEQVPQAAPLAAGNMASSRSPGDGLQPNSPCLVAKTPAQWLFPLAWRCTIRSLSLSHPPSDSHCDSVQCDELVEHRDDRKTMRLVKSDLPSQRKAAHQIMNARVVHGRSAVPNRGEKEKLNQPMSCKSLK